MNYTLHQLQIFIEVCKQKSITRDSLGRNTGGKKVKRNVKVEKVKKKERGVGYVKKGKP